MNAEVDKLSFCNHTIGKDIRKAMLFLRWEYQGLNYSLNFTFLGVSCCQLSCVSVVRIWISELY